MTWVEGWQGGLVFGAATSLLAEAAVRAFLFWRAHRDHPHCEVCKGCLRDNGRGFGAPEYLFECEVCGDTIAANMATAGETKNKIMEEKIVDRR